MKRFLTTTSGGDQGPEAKRSHKGEDAQTMKDEMTFLFFSILHKAGPKLRIVNWNVDGLDENQVEERASEVCSILLQNENEIPDVVFFQEVVPQTADIFRARFLSAGFEMAPSELPSNPQYFTLAFFKSSIIKIKKAKRTGFPGSDMGRDLVRVEAQVEGAKEGTSFLLMESHLESLGNPRNSAERCKQLNQVLDELLTFPGLALFAGDTNLREKEVAKESKYKSIVDAWIACGSPVNAKATWDLEKNANKRMPGSFQPRMRLDRILMNKAMAANGVEGFKLLGTEKMKEGMFPSDHFGITCIINLPSSSS